MLLETLPVETFSEIKMESRVLSFPKGLFLRPFSSKSMALRLYFFFALKSK